MVLVRNTIAQNNVLAFMTCFLWFICFCFSMMIVMVAMLAVYVIMHQRTRKKQKIGEHSEQMSPMFP